MGLLKKFGIETKAEKQLKAQQIYQYQKIFVDSYKILERTDNIQTFLSRYDTLINAIEGAAEIAGPDAKCFGGISPRQAREIARQDMPQLLNPCLERFVQKKTISICESATNRMKKAKALYGVLVAYEEQMPSESLVYWQFLIDRLVKKVEKIENMEKERIEK